MNQGKNEANTVLDSRKAVVSRAFYRKYAVSKVALF